MALTVLAIISVAFIGVMIALVCMLVSARPKPAHDASEDILARERIFARVSTRILGRHLADLAPGAKALVVSEKPMSPATLKPLLDGLGDGLAEGMGKPATIAAVDSPAQDLAADATPEGIDDAMAGPFCAAQLDAIIARHPDCRLIVSLSGMPTDYSDMAIWTEDPALRPIVAVAMGDVPMLRNAILGHAIHAAVLPRPDAGTDTLASDPQDIFDQRFLLATPDNIEELVAEHGHLFAE
jgi:hypothetical protein